MDPTKKSSKYIIGRYTLLLGASVVTFLFCEISMRIFLYIKSRKSFTKIMTELPKVKNDTPVGLGEMIQPSKNCKIIYGLRPNLRVYFANALAETNNNGWRSKDYPFKKDKNTVRVIGLGDSFMFGQGIKQGMDYLTILEREMNLRFPDKKWEIINTAVPGYNTVMEVETLIDKALMYGPDIVIIEYIGNDLDLPNFIYESYDYLNLKKSFILELFLSRYKLVKEAFRLYISPRGQKDSLRFENNPQNVPAQYEDMVGWDSFVTAMRKLQKMKEGKHFDVVMLITLGGRDDKVIDLGNSLGFYAAYNSVYKIDDPSVTLSREDSHYSEYGHKKTAEFLLNYMIQNKIIEKYIQ